MIAALLLLVAVQGPVTAIRAGTLIDGTGDMLYEAHEVDLIEEPEVERGASTGPSAG